MKTVILAGGRGSRISEESNLKPKPMIQIGKMPIIMHIIKIYEYHGFKEFIICGGYKQNVIKKFFKKHKYNFKVRVINTGIDTMTGGRILKLKNILKKDKNFFLTYGDGVSDVNIKKIYNLHLKKKKIVTLCAVRPNSKFGIIKFYKNSNNLVSRFYEKPKNHYISGGFFVISNKIFKYIKDSKSIFEFDCLPKLAIEGQLVAYKHLGFWHCLDTMKDKLELNKIWKSKNCPWRKW